MSALMLDIAGTELSAEDKNILDHPAVGGVILFSRNYENPNQLQALCQAIRQAARHQVLIAIDHEGGRVQRCRESFSAIPAMAQFEQLAANPKQAAEWARQCGWLMASEVLACGMDFSFAPVLDVNGISEVIGDRAFSADPLVVESLAKAFIDGMHDAGMAATAKHFPGHGSVLADSHIALPVDDRDYAQIEAVDLLPFKKLAANFEAVMPAHVIYPAVDREPAGFSHIWLQTILRQQLGFNGVIFSDDLSMEGAAVGGDFSERAERALDAGCDMVLVCNNRQAAINVIDTVHMPAPQRPYLDIMRGRPSLDWNIRQQSAQWNQAQDVLTAIRTQAGQ